MIFFVIGIIATIAVRAVTILSNANPVYVQFAWYIGVTGFLVFFIYKFKIDRGRYRLISESRIIEKITQDQTLSSEDRSTIGSIICALISNKDRINYFLIFITSFIALIIAVYFDFIRRMSS